MTWTLRPAGADEWRAARDLRVEMLADTPIAFGTTLAQAAQRSDADWQAAQERASDPKFRWVVAVDETGAWRGQAVGVDQDAFHPGEEPGIIAVYVAPPLRGQGVLAAMVSDIVAWLRGLGRDRCTLMVHEANGRAIRAYERLGFVPTGETMPYENEPGGNEIVMGLRL